LKQLLLPSSIPKVSSLCLLLTHSQTLVVVGSSKKVFKIGNLTKVTIFKG